MLQVQCLEDDDSRDGESVARESLREPDSVSETPGKTAEGKVKKVDWSRIHQEQRKARQRIVLWRHPLQTLVYFLKELQIEAVQAVRRYSRSRANGTFREWAILWTCSALGPL